jgi:hypothetical protein
VEAKREAARTAKTAARREAAERRRQNAAASSDESPGDDDTIPEPARTAEAATIANRSVRFLCQILLSDRRTRERLTAAPAPDFLAYLPETEVLSRIWSADLDPDLPGSVAAFTSTLPPAEQNTITSLLSSPLPENAAEFADDCLLSLQRQALQARIREVRARLKNPGLNPGEMENLTKQLLDLTNRLNDIPSPASGEDTGQPPAL